jgi:hypothetical protein
MLTQTSFPISVENKGLPPPISGVADLECNAVHNLLLDVEIPLAYV